MVAGNASRACIETAEALIESAPLLSDMVQLDAPVAPNRPVPSVFLIGQGPASRRASSPSASGESSLNQRRVAWQKGWEFGGDRQADDRGRGPRIMDDGVGRARVRRARSAG
jgi:hypothetical protein